MGVCEAGGVNVLEDECTSGDNLLYLNQEKRNVISLKVCPFAHYTSEGQILIF